jgi:hypothetical protein
VGQANKLDFSSKRIKPADKPSDEVQVPTLLKKTVDHRKVQLKKKRKREEKAAEKAEKASKVAGGRNIEEVEIGGSA